MKVLCHNFSNALYYIMEGWKNVFTNTGHEWKWVNPNEPILDVFNEYQPDIFIGATYEITRALKKALIAKPDTIVLMKANNWGHLDSEINTEIYPIGIAKADEIELVRDLRESVKKPDYVFNFYHMNRYDGTMEKWNTELGIGLLEGLPAADTFSYKKVEPKEELKCDIGFVGGYWPYKARNLDKYILPLCYPIGKYNVKIFGNQAWPVPQYMGNATNQTVEALFSSASILPNISEPHANVFGFEVNERVFKLGYSKAFIINDYIESLHTDIFKNNELVIADDPQDFFDLVHNFTINPQLKDRHIDAVYNTIVESHTYCHRVANMWKLLNNEEEANKCLSLIKTMIQ